MKTTPLSALCAAACASLPGAAWAAGEPLSFDPTGFSLMVAAYVCLWVLVAGFVATLLRRQSRASAKLEALTERFERETSKLLE